MADKRERPYRIGYGKPPRETQFKSGGSGNPTGRPKGAKNFATALEAELRATVPVTENGRRRKLSKQQILAKRLVNQAIDADPKFMGLLVNVVLDLQQRSGEAAVENIFGGPEQQPVFDSIVQRIRAAAETSSAPKPESDPNANEPGADEPEPSE